ncbi:RluA family pseudouridine synthase [Alkalimarinus alittae]|uniref:RluA family pseudouridine synthase n=1 Tax=Alkalimarinus alittae TaxID=2961619 RepID=A0ABY6MY46_9ALTE|nr:RluA family pseudouridine synthase [Alkalimarinus alittae]UZE94756.1 RluA family pseudouridine synthase [Alkalimarinus alittae]
MDAQFSFTVTQRQASQSLLDCLLPCIPYLNADQWLSLLNSGHIQVDNTAVRESVVIAEGQLVSYTVPDYQEAEVDTNWRLLWSNHEIAAIHKPSNLPVNRTTRNVYNTLIQLLRRESPWPEAHLLHRLDLETSGVLLVAQTNAMAKQYQPELSRLIKRKIYHAIVYGEPTWQALEYECDLSTLADSPIRCQMHKVVNGEGKKSKTGFKVLGQRAGFSLIQCELFTGRKHQIRAQLASLGHPIVGDKIYSLNGEMYLKRLEQPLSASDDLKLLTSHHLLHACEVHLNNIWQQDGTDIIIQDRDVSEQWTRFLP